MSKPCHVLTLADLIKGFCEPWKLQVCGLELMDEGHYRRAPILATVLNYLTSSFKPCLHVFENLDDRTLIVRVWFEYKPGELVVSPSTRADSAWSSFSIIVHGSSLIVYSGAH